MDDGAARRRLIRDAPLHLLLRPMRRVTLRRPCCKTKFDADHRIKVLEGCKSSTNGWTRAREHDQKCALAKEHRCEWSCGSVSCQPNRLALVACLVELTRIR